ncbi:hypothetical protein O9K51_09672 [Purpureocillium lavendulum]|uniref:Uncharacterized protein n=1 Tax=Purpureocillium lavendulum TaxID=1247861 RepID=A0AB34FEH2_9HYPO|nr:hypothetical protein O9K51_09672 [Purpureocillium lavendulum]
MAGLPPSIVPPGFLDGRRTTAAALIGSDVLISTALRAGDRSDDAFPRLATRTA